MSPHVLLRLVSKVVYRWRKGSSCQNEEVLSKQCFGRNILHGVLDALFPYWFLNSITDGVDVSAGIYVGQIFLCKQCLVSTILHKMNIAYFGTFLREGGTEE